MGWVASVLVTKFSGMTTIVTARYDKKLKRKTIILAVAIIVIVVVLLAVYFLVFNKKVVNGPISQAQNQRWLNNGTTTGDFQGLPGGGNFSTTTVDDLKVGVNVLVAGTEENGAITASSIIVDYTGTSNTAAIYAGNGGQKRNIWRQQAIANARCR